MATAPNNDESISDFLENLKLADKYSELFIAHGYLTVGDCYGITEETLKSIGVTLPGHYRRILNKLPGCSVKKPPRTNRSQSTEQQLSPEVNVPSKTNNAIELETEDVHEIEISTPDQTIGRKFRQEIEDIVALGSDSIELLPAKKENSTPAKPPRSPDHMRHCNLLPNFTESLFPEDPFSPIKVSASPASIKSALDVLMGDYPGESSKHSCGDEAKHVDVYDLPSSIPADHPNTDASLRNHPNTDASLRNHPNAASSVESEYSGGVGDLPPISLLQEGESVGLDVYDRLNLDRSGSADISGGDSGQLKNSNQAYSHLTGNPPTSENPPAEEVVVSPTPVPHKNLQVVPSRLPTYEEITLPVEEESRSRDPTQERPFSTEVNVDETAKTSVSLVEVSSSLDVVKPEVMTSEPIIPAQADTKAFTAGASATEQVYDLANESERKATSTSENVYDVCLDHNRSSSVITTSFAPAKSFTLPRSSGSLPASAINSRIQRAHEVVEEEGAARISGESMLSENFPRTNVVINKDASNDVMQTNLYQSINCEKEANDKHDSSEKIKRILKLGNKIKLGNTRKGLRPRSVMMIDSSRMATSNALSSSEENLDRVGLQEKKVQHKRAASISDAKIPTGGAFSSIELNDSQLSQGDRRQSSATSAHFASPMIRTKKGWLYKHGGADGRAPQRRRWVVFDGNEIIYYESDTKMDISKGVIPTDVILRIIPTPDDPKTFHIDTKGGRKYIFNAESTDERALWTSTLLATMMAREKQSQIQYKPGGSMYMPYKHGFLKMDGGRQKIFLATKADKLAYYKGLNEFNFGQPVARLSMNIATVKEVDKKKFQIIFPFKTFTMTAENEEERRSWVEALNDAIAEGLSDYKVVQEVWSAPENRKCADCGREEPDWASINLAIVICKHCAGVHRELGVHNSKVRSLKMDVKIWSENMRNLLVMLGNRVANSFWASRLTSSDAITDMADKKQRAWHITGKYIEMQYAEPHRHCGNQQLLNQSLVNAVRNDDVTTAYALLFTGADPSCSTGREKGKTPYLLAKYLRYDVMAEFLLQNGASDVVSAEGHVTDRSNCVKRKESLTKTKAKPPVMLKDFLFKYGGDFKNTQDEKRTARDFIIRRPGEFQKRMCVLENNTLKYYDPDKTSTAKDHVECSELISIALCQPEQATRAGYSHCFEMSRITGRTYLFCAERKELVMKWTRGLMQAIVPPHVQNAMKHDNEFDRIGKMWVKWQHYARKQSEWKSTWCKLKGKILQYFHQDSLTMEKIDLRRLVQLGLDLTQEGVTTTGANQSGKESVPTFMLVFREKSFYLHSDTKADSEAWLAAIKKADSDCGADLTDQQLTAEGVPIILEKCITYVEQFGLTMRGIYRLSGTHSKTTQLLNDFKQNARETQMRDSELNVHDVANALKRWFKSLPGSLLTEELHQQWIDTAQIKGEDGKRKLVWYKHLIERLPEINKTTLKVLLVHLNNVASQEKENDMSIHNLAIVFGPTLMESQEEGARKVVVDPSNEIGCVEDLLRYYAWLFDVTDIDREKERQILKAKEKISMATQQQSMVTTLDYDMMVPIYINQKDDKCVNYKVNMTAGELVARICRTHGYNYNAWSLFEVICDGEAERPLHHSEHVLSVIKTWEMPSTNYLLTKTDYVRDKIRWLKKPNGSQTEILFEGQLKVLDKKKWTRMNAQLKVADGGLSLCFVKNQEGSTSVRDVASGNWRKRSTRVQSISKRIGGNIDMKGAVNVSLGLYNAYLGVDRRTKPPTTGKNYGFTLAGGREVTRYFIAESETTVYKWFGNILLYKFGSFTPTSSPVISPDTEKPSRAFPEIENSKRFAFPTISQGELGEAAVAAALKRKPSSGSDDQSRDSLHDDASEELLDSSNLDQASLPPPSGRPTSLSAPPGDIRRSASYLTSPVDQKRQKDFFGMKLHSELSSVLKKRTEHEE